MNSQKYVVFLRGINVGKKRVEMAKLRSLFESMGFVNVSTLLNSGNVVFESSRDKNEVSLQHIEKQLEEAFGFHIDTIIRTSDEITDIVQKDPFQGIEVAKNTRFYVTFLTEKSHSTLQIPYESPEKDFKIIETTNSEVFSILTLSDTKGTTDVMKILEKEFGTHITTRNWNTIIKISKK